MHRKIPRSSPPLPVFEGEMWEVNEHGMKSSGATWTTDGICCNYILSILSAEMAIDRQVSPSVIGTVKWIDPVPTLLPEQQSTLASHLKLLPPIEYVDRQLPECFDDWPLAWAQMGCSMLKLTENSGCILIVN